MNSDQPPWTTRTASDCQNIYIVFSLKKLLKNKYNNIIIIAILKADKLSQLRRQRQVSKSNIEKILHTIVDAIANYLTCCIVGIR